VLAGCDQFARVGVMAADAATGSPSVPSANGGAAGEPDIATAEDAGAEPQDAGSECTPVDIAVCNPVTNEGCPGSLAMQCAVDWAATLSGYCIFSSPPPVAGADTCFNSGVTESCPPTFTCVVDQCRRLCLCDADCEQGQCCTEEVGSTGFHVCRDC
jgi:hypothetical protein